MSLQATATTKARTTNSCARAHRWHAPRRTHSSLLSLLHVSEPPEPPSPPTASAPLHVVARGHLRTAPGKFALPPEEGDGHGEQPPLGQVLDRRIGLVSLRTWLLLVSAVVFASVVQIAREIRPREAVPPRVRRVPLPEPPAAPSTVDPVPATTEEAAAALFAGDLLRARRLYRELARKDPGFSPLVRAIEQLQKRGCASAPCLPVRGWEGQVQEP